MIENLPGYFFMKNQLKLLRREKRTYEWNGLTIRHRGTTADLGVIDQIFIKEDYDLKRLKRFKELVDFYEQCADPLIIDAGANIGISTIWFAKKFPKAKIIAIEPESHNYSLLQDNVKVVNANPFHGALASERGFLKVLDPGHGEWGFRTALDGDGFVEEVKAFEIGDFLKSESTPFILKMDIEGGEAEVFSKNTSDFNKFPLIIIELHDWMLPRSRSSQPFLAWHVEQNRDFVYINENVFSISNDIDLNGR